MANRVHLFVGMILAFSLLFVVPAQAYGRLACSNYTNHFHRSEELRDKFVIWAEGFVQGRNYEGHRLKAPKKDLSWLYRETIKWRTLEYCSKHPDQLYAEAVIDLYLSLPELPPQTAPASR